MFGDAIAILVLAGCFLAWLQADYCRMCEQDRYERAEQERRLEQIDRLLDDLGVKRR